MTAHWQRLWNAWTHYWFRHAPVFDLAVTRIIVIVLQLWRLVGEGEFLPNLISRSQLPDALYHPLNILRLMTLPLGTDYRPSQDVLLMVFWVTLIAGLIALVGFKTNFSLFVFATGCLFLRSFMYSFREFHHPEALMFIALFLLAFSPSGAALSLDNVLRRRRNNAMQETPVIEQTSIFARWPLLLIRWLFALIYLSAATSKLSVNPGPLDWMNGYTLQYIMLFDGLRHNIELGVWLSNSHTLAVLLSWGSIIFESTFFLVVLFPRLWWIYIPAGLGFHASILLIQKADFYEYMALYAVFVPWSSLARKAAVYLSPQQLRARFSS